MDQLLAKAIAKQREGADYYGSIARSHAQNALREVFALLAEDEKRHEMILQAAKDHLPIPLQDDGTRQKVANLFSDLEEQKADIPAPIEQVDVYRAAWEVEKQSVALYEQLFDKCGDEESRALYAFLIDQEKMHMEVMESLYQHVNRPNEWVESAEFGLREEY